MAIRQDSEALQYFFFKLGSVKNSEWGFHRAKAGIGSSQNHQTNEISPDLDYWM